MTNDDKRGRIDFTPRMIEWMRNERSISIQQRKARRAKKEEKFRIRRIQELTWRVIVQISQAVLHDEMPCCSLIESSRLGEMLYVQYIPYTYGPLHALRDWASHDLVFSLFGLEAWRDNDDCKWIISILIHIDSQRGRSRFIISAVRFGDQRRRHILPFRSKSPRTS